MAVPQKMSKGRKLKDELKAEVAPMGKKTIN